METFDLGGFAFIASPEFTLMLAHDFLNNTFVEGTGDIRIFEFHAGFSLAFCP